MTIRTSAIVGIMTTCLWSAAIGQTVDGLTDAERDRIARFHSLTDASSDVVAAPVGDTLAEQRAAYVDRSTSIRKLCPAAPFRPGWVMVHDWKDNTHNEKARIGQSLYLLRASSTILDLGECTCELRFPPWEPMRAEYEALIAPLQTHDQAQAVEVQLLAESRSLWVEAKPLCDDWW